jgi:RNA polymerase sigma-70 factor (ECF subfamily)
MDIDLVDCLARVRGGDDEAARALVEHLYPMMIKIVGGHLPRRADAEDLMQDIFLKMFVHLDQYRGVVSFERWVSRIAMNHCINASRFQRVRPEWRFGDLSEEQAEVIEALATDPDRQPHPSEALDARDILDRLLAGLAPRERMLIQWLEIEDRTIEDVRQLTGWSAVRVRVSVFRARAKLNRLYREMKEQGKT